jgi:hypothetical protein
LTSRCHLSALLAVCLLLLVGCSHQSGTDKAYMDVEFSTLDLAIARTIAGQQARPGLESLTDQYITTTRKYDDELGDDEVKRRLADKATEVQDWCPSCAAALDRERETYG